MTISSEEYAVSPTKILSDFISDSGVLLCAVCSLVYCLVVWRLALFQMVCLFVMFPGFLVLASCCPFPSG